MRKFWVVITGVTLLAFGMLVSPATATQPTCPTPAHWESLVWHTWTGGPVDSAPAVGDEGWHATSGNPQSANHSIPPRVPNVPYFVSHGGHGKGDWFLWTGVWVEATECPTESPEPSVTPEPSITPTPDVECPEGQVPGSPGEDGVFKCQNDDPHATPEPAPETPEAPTAEQVVHTPTFTG